jgi:5'(3')-deoxyribonucleotidase
VILTGVLNEFQYHFFHYLGKHNYSFDTSKWDDYNISKAIQEKNPRRIMNEIFNMDDFWLSIPTTLFSYDGLKHLNDNYTLFIATQPCNKYNETLKKQWIGKNFSFINPAQIIFSDEKWKLKGDVIIEDKPATIEACKDVGMHTIKYMQQYNNNCQSDFVLSSWKNIKYLMKEVENECYSGRK